MLTAAERINKSSVVFYKLCLSDGDHSYTSVDGAINSVMATAEDNSLDLAEFYTACLNAMLVGSSLDRARRSQQMTALDSCAIHYHLEVVWHVLGLLPPPPAFLLQMTGSVILV